MKKLLLPYELERSRKQIARQIYLFCLFLHLFFVGLPSVLGSEQDAPVALVDGVADTDEDLNLQFQLLRLEHQAYLLRLQALDKWLSQHLLEKAATDQCLRVEELLRQEVDSQITESSAGKGASAQAKTSGKPANLQQARQNFLRRLREQASVKILPDPPRLSARVGGAPRKGSSNAPVTVVEFSDFHCPYCKKVQSALSDILAQYKDQVSLVFKDVPLVRLHPGADVSAEAARCAGEQGKFWEYHDALFTATVIQPETYREIAYTLSLDGKALQTCMDSRKYRDQDTAETLLPISYLTTFQFLRGL